jgi:hypothetical protein
MSLVIRLFNWSRICCQVDLLLLPLYAAEKLYPQITRFTLVADNNYLIQLGFLHPDQTTPSSPADIHIRNSCFMADCGYSSILNAAGLDKMRSNLSAKFKKQAFCGYFFLAAK